MNHKSVLCRSALLFLAALPIRLFAVDTHIWEHSDQGDFIRGTAKKLSIRSDGHLTLAPQLTELDSTTVPYLWALAQDGKGTLYYAGGAPTGNTAQVFSLTPGGKSKTFSSLTGLEVHALAVDSQDRVYAAVLPDAKIYRIDGQGKPTLFFDAKCKYIWSMAFDKSNNLFVATGDQGVIYKVTPDGKGTKFFSTGETHARSMTFDDAGNIIAGTEPSGLIIRITPAGEGFVLYQANKREVTAVAVHQGIIYATAVGNKTGGLTVTGPAPVLPTAPPPAVTGAGTTHAGTQPPTMPPAVGSLSATITGGTELYRIQADGLAERIWTSATDIAYAIAFDANGKPLVGTGNKGNVIRIDSEQLSTEILNTPPTQVTALLQGSKGVIYAVTGNVGNVYSIGPGTETSGTLDSEALDAGGFAQWGKVHVNPTPGGGITFETRSGNLNHPESLWSPWIKVKVTELGGQIASPAARFLQYRLTLSRNASGPSPEVSLIDLAYLPKNIAPRVTQVEMAPVNYRQAQSASTLERAVLPSGSPASLTLPAVGQKRSSPSSIIGDSNASATLQYSKGYMTARWNASDADNDPLLFKVEIKGKRDSVWRMLKDKLQDRYYAFDSNALPDGSYQVRVTASDAPANVAADALSSSLTSEEFIIDNTPPEIVASNTTKQIIHFTAKDALSWIDKAEYSVNGGDWTILEPVNKVTDSQSLDYEVSGEPGQLISVRVFDEYDNVAVKQFTRN